MILTKIDFITQWRASVKEAPRLVEVVRPELLVNLERYPTLEVQTIHSSRASQVGLHKIKELNFIARPLGVISSAANKYIEVLMALGLTLVKSNVNSILSMAEGSGGTLATLSGILGVKNCYYNSLNTETVDRRDDITDTRPTSFIALGRCDDLKDGRLARGTTDITISCFSQEA